LASSRGALGRTLHFRYDDVVRRDCDQIPTLLSRIAQEIKIVLSPVMFVAQNLSVFPLHIGLLIEPRGKDGVLGRGRPRGPEGSVAAIDASAHRKRSCKRVLIASELLFALRYLREHLVP